MTLALDACADDDKSRRDQEEETQTSVALNQDTLCFELEILVVVCCLQYLVLVFSCLHVDCYLLTFASGLLGIFKF